MIEFCKRTDLKILELVAPNNLCEPRFDRCIIGHLKKSNRVYSSIELFCYFMWEIKREFKIEIESGQYDDEDVADLAHDYLNIMIKELNDWGTREPLAPIVCEDIDFICDKLNTLEEGEWSSFNEVTHP